MVGLMRTIPSSSSSSAHLGSARLNWQSKYPNTSLKTVVRSTSSDLTCLNSNINMKLPSSSVHHLGMLAMAGGS